MSAAGSLLALGLVAANGNCEPPEPSERIYGLTDDSAFAEGCFPPATCPTVLEDLGGTFRLELIAPGNAVDLYAVRDVFWLLRSYGEDIPITGSGVYRDGLLEDRLQLDLEIGDEGVQHFDSGFVPGEGPLGSDLDISVSIDGQRLFDTVIEVRALLFPPALERTACGPLGLTCDAESDACPRCQ